jgi:hypothetical protein
MISMNAHFSLHTCLCPFSVTVTKYLRLSDLQRMGTKFGSQFQRLRMQGHGVGIWEGSSCYDITW